MSIRNKVVAGGIASVVLSAVVLLGARQSPQDGVGGQLDDLLGTIEIAGRVVSEGGEPLEGVTIVVTTSYSRVPGDKMQYQDERIVVDGSFSVTRRLAQFVRLGFVKPGYFYQCRDFWSFDRKEKRSGGYTSTDLLVVLEKKPEPAPLDVMKGQLLADAEGVVAVLKLVPGTRDASDARKAGGAKLTDPCVVLEVGTTADGQVERKKWRFASGTVAEVPARAAVAFSTPDAGFVVYTPSSPPVREDLCFREMKQAPETGYVQRLDFTDDVGDYVYFYCRIGSNFGKGRMSRPNFLHRKGPDSSVVAPITILLNPHREPIRGHGRVAGACPLAHPANVGVDSWMKDGCQVRVGVEC